MAAFSASRLVCSAMPVIVSTIAADPLGLAGERRSIAPPTWAEDVGDRADRVGRLRGGLDALAGGRAGLLGGLGGRARGARRCAAAARAASCDGARGSDSTMRTWRSAPCATSLTAEAMVAGSCASS